MSISGASRELTEGFGSLFAALVLISVGIWMHGKSQADAWQVYIREKMSKALSRRSAWFLFLLAFVVVYREVFETILFLVALWSQGGHVALLLGVLAAALTLGVIAWALLGYSRRLPIGKFFGFSSILLAILAVVLAGKGVSGLQESRHRRSASADLAAQNRPAGCFPYLGDLPGSGPDPRHARDRLQCQTAPA